MKRIGDMSLRDLIDALEDPEHADRGIVASEARLRVYQHEHALREAQVSVRHWGDSHRRIISRLIALAPANGKRKNVATADVKTIWYEEQ